MKIHERNKIIGFIKIGFLSTLKISLLRYENCKENKKSSLKRMLIIIK